MGQRSASETIARILLAFTEQPTWAQAELARRLELGVPALRRKLMELSSGGMPLDRDDEDPPQVFWSVPKGWFPGGVILDGREVHRMLRALLHLPRSSTRDRLLGMLTTLAPPGDVQPSPDAVVTAELPADQETLLTAIEEAMGSKVAVRMRYQSRSGTGARWRRVSVHRVVATDPLRLVVTCHETGALRWFRLDHVREVAPLASEPHREAHARELETFMAASVDGFHGGTTQVEEFEAREPDARWVAENLRKEWQGRWEGSVLRVRAETAALVQVARFVVGLGASGRALTPGLASAVRELAAGAMKGNE